MSELPNNDHFAEVKPGMSFTGVIDGSFPGEYLITVGVGNCPTLSGVAITSDQPAQIERNVNVPIIPTNTSLTQKKQKQKNIPPRNTENPESRMDINIDEVPPRF
ncbi:hypothetical protein QL285_002625 [Trifolium repens]|nr:hypothetical protein QL285_002625 [Trifolium repens]